MEETLFNLLHISKYKASWGLIPMANRLLFLNGYVMPEKLDPPFSLFSTVNVGFMVWR